MTYERIETEMRPIGYRKAEGMSIHCREVPGPEASAAIDFCKQWGMVAAMPDGEDSAGRHKVRLATPEEVAERAVATAVALFQKLRDADLLIPAPSIEQLNEELRRSDNE